MKNYHCCATCVHYEIRKGTREKFYCSRLNFATQPKYQFSCWQPKEHIIIKLQKKEEEPF